MLIEEIVPHRELLIHSGINKDLNELCAHVLTFSF